MATTETLEAIVLKAYDVGEADRFCVLLTRERGRIAARARGVRKPTSRMGGSLLPLRHVDIEVREGSSGFHVSSVHARERSGAHQDIDSFLELQQCVELLLCLLHDEEPLEDVFVATKQLCTSESVPRGSSLSFSLRLLHMLGMLPHHDEGVFGEALHEDEREYIRASLSPTWLEERYLEDRRRMRLRRLCDKILAHHVNAPLRSPAVAAETAHRADVTPPRG